MTEHPWRNSCRSPPEDRSKMPMIVRQERRWTVRGRSSIQRNQGNRDEQSRDRATVAALPCRDLARYAHVCRGELGEKANPPSVIPGLEPGIHATAADGCGLDARLKAEQDGVWGGGRSHSRRKRPRQGRHSPATPNNSGHSWPHPSCKPISPRRWRWPPLCRYRHPQPFVCVQRSRRMR